MSWSPREERAINHYMKENNLRLELQSQGGSVVVDQNEDQLGLMDVPQTPGRSVYFTDKATSERVIASLDLLLVIYDQDKAERTRERARARRQEAKARR